jgi:predicted permease
MKDEKTKIGFRETLGLLGYGLGLVWKMTPGYLPLMLAHTFITAAQPLAVLFFSARLLNELTGARDLRLIVIYASLALGLALNAIDFEIPQILNRALIDTSGMTTPMALICLGGGMKFLGFSKRFNLAIIAAVIKVIILPAIFMVCAYFMGFRGIDLAALTVLGGLPSAIVGYVLVVQMGGDGYTAGSIVLISTLASSVTLTIFIYVLLALGLM